jgi:hypothetical protein
MLLKQLSRPWRRLLAAGGFGFRCEIVAFRLVGFPGGLHGDGPHELLTSLDRAKAEIVLARFVLRHEWHVADGGLHFLRAESFVLRHRVDEGEVEVRGVAGCQILINE